MLVERQYQNHQAVWNGPALVKICANVQEGQRENVLGGCQCLSHGFIYHKLHFPITNISVLNFWKIGNTLEFPQPTHNCVSFFPRRKCISLSSPLFTLCQYHPKLLYHTWGIVTPVFFWGKIGASQNTI